MSSFEMIGFITWSGNFEVCFYHTGTRFLDSEGSDYYAV